MIGIIKNLLYIFSKHRPKKKNNLNGISRRWYKNGQLEYEETYQNGKKHGVAKVWYENGQISNEVPWQNNKLHGIAKGWYENGQLNFEYHYLYGKQVTEEEYRKHELIKHLAGLEIKDEND